MLRLRRHLIRGGSGRRLIWTEMLLLDAGVMVTVSLVAGAAVLGIYYLVW